MKYLKLEGGPIARWLQGRRRLWLALVPLLAIVLFFVLPLGTCRRSTEQTLKHAAEAWDSRDYKAAAELYEDYLGRNSDGEATQEARLQLANIYYLNLRRYELARDRYKEFLNQAPSHPNAPQARERLGDVLAELGRSYEAIAEYENLAPQDKDEARRIRLRIADLYFDQKNYSQAITEYAKVSEGAPYDDLTEQACLREVSILHLTRGQYQQAMSVYLRLLSESADPKVRRRAQYGIADCYAGLYQFDDAIKTLREVSDESERNYISRRIEELEQRKRDAIQARSRVQK